MPTGRLRRSLERRGGHYTQIDSARVDSARVPEIWRHAIVAEDPDPEPQELPTTPSPGLLFLLWLNTLALGAFGGLMAVIFGPQKLLGRHFDISPNAAVEGLLWAVPWLLLSVLPLEKWFPKKLAFLKEVGDHTEVFTALAFGAQFGNIRRWLTVLFGTFILSLSAGALEELVFRGTAQSALCWALDKVFIGLPLVSNGLAIFGASFFFGILHNYCKGYAVSATLAGCFFGTVFAVTDNLFVPAVAHAVVDAVAFLSCYVAVARASDERKRHLASKHFPITAALRRTRDAFDNGYGFFFRRPTPPPPPPPPEVPYVLLPPHAPPSTPPTLPPSVPPPPPPPSTAAAAAAAASFSDDNINTPPLGDRRAPPDVVAEGPSSATNG